MMDRDELLAALREIVRVITTEIDRPGDNEDRYRALKRALAVAEAALERSK
jgi:hypothetical protein